MSPIYSIAKNDKRNGYSLLFNDLIENFEKAKEIPFDVKKERINYCIKTYLKEDEEKAIRLRYGLYSDGCSTKMTLKEIGEILDIPQTASVDYKILKLFKNPRHKQVQEILLRGDEAIKEFEDRDRVYSRLSEFPYKIYDEDKEYIKDHYKHFRLDKTNLDPYIIRFLHKKYIDFVGILLDKDLKEVERGIKLSHKTELTTYVCTVISNVSSLNASDIESPEILDMDMSDIIKRIDKLKEQIKANDAEAYLKEKEISEANKERNKILEEEIESLQSMINGKEVD